MDSAGDRAPDASRFSVPRRPGRTARSRAGSRRLRVLMVAAAIVLAWWGSGLPSHTWTATIAVAVPVLGVTVSALLRPGGAIRPDPRLRLAFLCWGVLLVVAVSWEIWVFSRQPAWNVPNPDYPTLTVLLESAFEQRGVRFGGWLVWLYAGARLAR